MPIIQAAVRDPVIYRPFPWGDIARPYPLINASFRQPMQSGTVRIMVDGRNETAIARVRSHGFEVTPAFPLSVGTHRVRISGLAQDGTPICDGWTFVVTM